MLNLDLPVSPPTLVLWTTAVVAGVILVWVGYRWLRGRRAASDPWAPRASNSDAVRRWRRRQVLSALALLPILVLLFLPYRSSVRRSTDGPRFVREPEEGLHTAAAPVPLESAASEDGLSAGRVASPTPLGDQLVIWSGDGQTGAPGAVLRRSLAVVVQSPDGRPVGDRTVHFEVQPGGGSVGSTTVRTSASGLATTSWKLGQDPRALMVRAYLADRPGMEVWFTATLDSSPPTLGVQSAATESSTVSAGDNEQADAAAPPLAEAADDGAEESSSGPEPAVAPRRSASWSAGGVHTCRVNGAGGVSCWGFGPGPSIDRALEGVIWGVAAGLFDVCAITEQSTIGCWPDGTTNRAALSGEWSLPGGAQPEELAVGSEHICARSAAGRVYCWGSNERGQLGIPGVDRRQPVEVPGIGDVVQLAAGWFHTCAVTESGAAYCWGANGAGQLGRGAGPDQSRPVAVDHAGPFRDLVSGSSHSCALGVTGDVWCWGSNQYGQLGPTLEASVSPPRSVSTDLRFVSLAAGGVHTCGLTASGQAWCWGRNVFGQLGNGTTSDSRIPVRVAGSHVFARLAAGGSHTCGETAGRELYCWGNNIQGQLGDGTRDNRTTPVVATRGSS